METNKLQYVLPNTFFIYNGKTYVKERSIACMGSFRCLARDLATGELVTLPVSINVIM